MNYLTNYKAEVLEDDEDDIPQKNKENSTVVAPGCSKTKDKKIKSPIVESEAKLEMMEFLNKSGIVLGPSISIEKSQREAKDPGIGQGLLNRRTELSAEAKLEMLETKLEKSEEDRNNGVKEIEWFRKEQKRNEKKIKDLENNHNNDIQGLENLNAGLKINLDETTKKLNDVRNKLDLKNAEMTNLKKNEETTEKLNKEIGGLQDTVISNNYEIESFEKRYAELENKLEETNDTYGKEIRGFQDVVTTKNNAIQELENFNADLKKKLEETTENLNDVKSKLNFQNDLRKKGYDDYQVKLASMNTTIDRLESSLKEANTDLKNEIHLKNSLKETNAEKDTKIEGLERLHLEVKSEYEAKLEKCQEDRKDLENNLEETNKIVTSNNNTIQGLENLNADLKIKLVETTKELNKLHLKNAEMTNLEKNEETSEILNKEIRDLQKVVTAKNNNIQDLENLNANLKQKLEETTEILNNVKSKLNLQTNLRQRGYEEYQVELVSKNTTINQLESSLKHLKEANTELTNEIHLKDSLKEKNAEKDTMIESLERSNLDVKSELEKTKQDIQMLENQLKTGLKAQLKDKIKELEDSHVELQLSHYSEVSSRNNKIKNLEIQIKTLEEDLKVA